MYHSSARIYDTLMITSCFVEELKLFQDKSCQMCLIHVFTDLGLVLLKDWVRMNNLMYFPLFYSTKPLQKVLIILQ